MNTAHSYIQVRGRGREARSECGDTLHRVYTFLYSETVLYFMDSMYSR